MEATTTERYASGGPARDVTRGEEHDPGRGGERTRQREERVRRPAREERGGFVGGKGAARDRGRR